MVRTFCLCVSLLLVGSPGWVVADENSCREGVWSAESPAQLHDQYYDFGYDLGPEKMRRVHQIINDRTHGCESLAGPERDMAVYINKMRGEVQAMDMFWGAIRDRKAMFEQIERKERQSTGTP